MRATLVPLRACGEARGGRVALGELFESQPFEIGGKRSGALSQTA
jgi:hypothetical protein